MEGVMALRARLYHPGLRRKGGTSVSGSAVALLGSKPKLPPKPPGTLPAEHLRRYTSSVKATRCAHSSPCLVCNRPRGKINSTKVTALLLSTNRVSRGCRLSKEAGRAGGGGEKKPVAEKTRKR